MEKPKRDCVADTSSLIALAKGGDIDCLGKLFRKVYIPEEVKRECQDSRTAIAIQKPFFEIKKVKKLLPINIHKGELEAISLAVELGVYYIIANDKKANVKALEYNLKPLPYHKILIAAKRIGCIKSVKTILDTIKANKEGIKKEVYLETLEEAGEL